METGANMWWSMKAHMHIHVSGPCRVEKDCAIWARACCAPPSFCRPDLALTHNKCSVSVDVFKTQSGTSRSSQNKGNARWLVVRPQRSDTRAHTLKHTGIEWCDMLLLPAEQAMMLLKALPDQPCCFIIHALTAFYCLDDGRGGVVFLPLPPLLLRLMHSD